ncbi:MAG: 30S ribosomal protein S18 [Alphaproteobacteria bacterium]|nr:30S ribosomal protein S18 [Alphaproteobacteria bacterium]NDC56451.1 30S ribosomal protein S18 [Alphaproteobacteria bacterium]NDG04351.1 30S ribosomal protein S18 [Alphaproteobacteria bacterium]
MNARFDGGREGRGEGREGREPREGREGRGDAGGMGRRSVFRRRKSCPFSSPQAPKIDYKNVSLLKRFVTERGKVIPCRISAVSAPKQRELTVAIKRARMLALLPYCDVRSAAASESHAA